MPTGTGLCDNFSPEDHRSFDVTGFRAIGPPVMPAGLPASRRRPVSQPRRGKTKVKSGKKTGIFTRIARHFRGPTFEELLEESTESLGERPIMMTCPRCGHSVPAAEKCANCGRPRQAIIDKRV